MLFCAFFLPEKSLINSMILLTNNSITNLSTFLGQNPSGKKIDTRANFSLDIFYFLKVRKG